MIRMTTVAPKTAAKYLVWKTPVMGDAENDIQRQWTLEKRFTYLRSMKLSGGTLKHIRLGK
ncbi:hypothetical protein ACU1JV_10245 [Paenibacillus sp. T2-29]